MPALASLLAPTGGLLGHAVLLFHTRRTRLHSVVAEDIPGVQGLLLHLRNALEAGALHIINSIAL